MEPLSTALLATALFEAGKKLADKGLVDPALEKGLENFKSWLTSGYDAKKADADLRKSFSAVIADLSGSEKDDDEIVAWLKGVGLDRLQAPRNEALRKQVATALISFTDPEDAPPEELIDALGWPRSRATELSMLLARLRENLSQNASWKPLFDYANDAEQRGLLKDILSGVAHLERTLVKTSAGEALRAVLVDAGVSDEQAEEIDLTYRKGLQRDFENLRTQGLSPAQLPKSIQLPLKDVYLELGLIPLRTRREQEAELQQLLEAKEPERLERETRHQQQRVTDALLDSSRLVIVGKPGSGKTVSLKFIALMLAFGETGVIRLRLDKAYVPLYVRLADYADKFKNDSTLALETFLLQYIEKNYPGAKLQGEFLRTSLDRGECMVLLDGLDEVGDIGDSLLYGKTLRSFVIDQVQRFSDRRCSEDGSNRVIVSSRLEGYHGGDLSNFDEMELAALSVPDEVQDFLLRWFTAYEQEYHPEPASEAALRKAQERVQSLMNDIMRSESVQRLAMNPLLLTILAMIHEMGTRLPNERVKLYETVAKTMIENWRLAQTKHVSSIYNVIPTSRILPLMASLAYWLHENQPGGAMPEADWQIEIKGLLMGDNDDDIDQRETDELVDLFLRHAREEVGLLTERSPGQIGFFHLTLEEYLAAFEIARQETDQRREMVARHWANPRWQEVVLLTAGQLMLNASMALDTFINDLRTQDDQKEPELIGRPALLAGLAVIDVGREHFRRKVVQDVRDDLLEAAQNLHPQNKRPVLDQRVPILTRALAADALDELGYTPEDLHTFIKIVGRDAIPPYWVAKYPVTNLQYERFLRPENFENKELWTAFPKFSEPDKEGEIERIGDWGEEAWDWLQETLRREGEDVQEAVLLPRYWRDPRFGIARKTAPVVGITWYEANAYCKWLLANWDDLDEGQQGLEKPVEIRLPTEPEWETAAGGREPEGRFAWDKPGDVTPNEKVPLFANTFECGINHTTPVWAYPQGASYRFGLMDISGNVFEWQANLYNKQYPYPAWRGGSWHDLMDFRACRFPLLVPPGLQGLLPGVSGCVCFPSSYLWTLNLWSLIL